MNSPKLSSLITILLLFVLSAGMAKTNSDYQVPIEQWLSLGPLQLSLPVFNEVKNLKGKTFKIEDLLDFEFIDTRSFRPQEGQSISGFTNSELKWHTVTVDSNGLAFEINSQLKRPQLYFLYTKLDAKRFVKTTLNLKSNYLYKVFWDEREILANKKQANKAALKNHKLEIEPGTHQLLIKLIISPQQDDSSRLQVKFSLPEPFKKAVKLHIAPTEQLSLHHLLESPRPTSVQLSPDGTVLAINYRSKKRIAMKPIPGWKFAAWTTEV